MSHGLLYTEYAMYEYMSIYEYMSHGLLYTEYDIYEYMSIYESWPTLQRVGHV